MKNVTKERMREVLSIAKTMLTERREALMRDIRQTPEGCDSRPGMIVEHDRIVEWIGDCLEVLE